MNRPVVVCLCGSTRFKSYFIRATREQTLMGRIVLSVGLFGHSGDHISDDEKRLLDELHLRKIDIADEVMILCPGLYIGESTRNEISYAEAHNKTVVYDARDDLDDTVWWRA